MSAITDLLILFLMAYVIYYYFKLEKELNKKILKQREKIDEMEMEMILRYDIKELNKAKDKLRSK